MLAQVTSTRLLCWRLSTLADARTMAALQRVGAA